MSGPAQPCHVDPPAPGQGQGGAPKLTPIVESAG